MNNHAVRQAVVLCAGRATRLGRLGANLPKAMLPIEGRPLIAHIVDKLLRGAGFEQVVIVVGQHGEMFRELFAKEPRVKLCWQGAPEGTAAALLAAEGQLQDRSLLTYGDLWVGETDYRQLREQAQPENVNYVAVNFNPRPLGAAVYLKGEKLVRLVEKPQWERDPDTCWNAAGLYVLSRDIVQYCREVPRSIRGEFELTEALQLALERGARFARYIMSQPQVDIGTPERYQALCESLSKPTSSSDLASASSPIAAPTPLGE